MELPKQWPNRTLSTMAAVVAAGTDWLSWALGTRPASHRWWRLGAAPSQVAGPHGAAGHGAPGGLGIFGVPEEDALGDQLPQLLKGLL